MPMMEIGCNFQENWVACQVLAFSVEKVAKMLFWFDLPK